MAHYSNYKYAFHDILLQISLSQGNMFGILVATNIASNLTTWDRDNRIGQFVIANTGNYSDNFKTGM